MTSKQPIDASDLANDGAKASRLDVDQSINKPSAPPAAEIAPFSWLCFVIVASASFLSFLEYGVVMPSMEPYIRSIDNSSTASVMYSLSMSAFSFGRLCSLPFFGWWCDRNIMFHVLFASLLVDGCGNLLYGFAGAANSPYMILFGRLVSGLAAGNGALSMVYVALTTTPARRTGLMTLAAGSTSLAVALGPCLTLIINKMPFNVTGKVRFDSLTGPGFFVFVLDVAMAGVVALFFTSPSIEVVRVRERCCISVYPRTSIVPVCAFAGQSCDCAEHHDDQNGVDQG